MMFHSPGGITVTISHGLVQWLDIAYI